MSLFKNNGCRPTWVAYSVGGRRRSRFRPRNVKLITRILLVALSSVMMAESPLRSSAREIENIAAFARLYGVVRFFFPGDMGASIDWNSFAVYGVMRVRPATDSRMLGATIREIFAPLGPGVEVATHLPPFVPPRLSGDPLVAWRYLGPGATEAMNGTPYAAKTPGSKTSAAAPTCWNGR
jgi:hypothetical protein